MRDDGDRHHEKEVAIRISKYASIFHTHILQQQNPNPQKYIKLSYFDNHTSASGYPLPYINHANRNITISATIILL